MLKDFIQHIQDTTLPQIHEKGERTFVVTSAGEVSEIRETIDTPATLSLNSLDAMVQMVKTEAIGRESGSPLYITIPTHTEVRCFAQINPKQRETRQTYYVAKATDVPGWDDSVKLGFEEAQIALRTRFQHTNDADYALKLLSDISMGAKVIYNDNGIATTVTTQKGIALQTNSQIKPLLSLRPYRTFQEVDQPESLFLLRVNERGISFTEADGGMWKLKARETVKDYFCDHLEKEISDGLVVVAL